MTEKNYNPNQKERNAMKKQPKPTAIKETPKKEKDVEEKKVEKIEKIEEKKSEESKTDKKETKKVSKKIKKEEVCVNAKSVPVSTKYAIGICKFVKRKRIGDAIRDLEQVVLLKKPVPMKGEYAHKKGKGISGGKYPQSAAKHFIVLLKSLAGNANNHEIIEPIIIEARANWAPSPRGRFGRVRRKRSHITLKAIEMKTNKTEKKKDKKVKSNETKKENKK